MKSPLPGDSSGSRETLEQPVAGTQRCCSVVIEQPSLIAAESDVCVTSENLKNDVCREVRMGAGGPRATLGAPEPLMPPQTFEGRCCSSFYRSSERDPPWVIQQSQSSW